MGFLAYDKNEKLAFNFKKACGLWLMAVASVIAVATLIGGKQIINMQVFSIGYIVVLRSEERRVGKECRSRWSPYH